MSSTTHQTKIINALLEICSHINSSIHYRKVAYNCLISLQANLELTRLCFWANDATEPHYLESKVYFDLEKPEKIDLAQRKNPIAQVFRNSITIASPKANSIEHLIIPKNITSSTLGFIAVPINVNNHCVGVLSAFRIGFSTMFYEDILSLKTAASIIAQTIKLKGFVDSETLELKKQNQELKNQLNFKFNLKNFLYQSTKMKQVLNIVQQVAHTNAAILLQGESGVGKTAIAQGIHYSSNRKDKPFIVVNCSAIPENLLESELFGHLKGAFTGAIQSREGKFEAAQAGTIFLDEIGEISLAIQTKLLRVIQNNCFEKLGSNQTIESKARIIFATNANLEEKLNNNTLREDFYYRLMVVPICIPALRERPEDIRLFVHHFWKFFEKKYDKKVHFKENDLNLLYQYHWPGNIRELENTIERFVILTLNNQFVIRESMMFIHTPKFNQKKIDTPQRKPYQRATLKKKSVVDALEYWSGVQIYAARHLDISARQIQYAIKKWNINTNDFKN